MSFSFVNSISSTDPCKVQSPSLLLYQTDETICPVSFIGKICPDSGTWPAGLKGMVNSGAGFGSSCVYGWLEGLGYDYSWGGFVCMVLRVGYSSSWLGLACVGYGWVLRVGSGMSRVWLGLAGSPTRNCRLGDSPAWPPCTSRRSSSSSSRSANTPLD